MKHTTFSILPVSLLLLLAVTCVCTTAPAQTPTSLRSSPASITAQYLYASGSSSRNFANGVIAGFRVGAGGKLTYTGQAFPVRGTPHAFVQSARGAKLFAASAESIWTFAVTPTTGILKLLAVLRRGATTMAINPQSTLLFVFNFGGGPNIIGDEFRITTFRIAPTGVLTPIASLRIAPSTGSLAVDPAGRFLYVVQRVPGRATFEGISIAQFAINQATGALTLKNRFTPSDLSSALPGGLAMHPTGRFLYLGLLSDSAVSVFSINPVTGALKSIQFQHCNCGSPGGGTRIAMDPRGNVLFSGVGAGLTAYTINASTGLLTPVPDSFQSLFEEDRSFTVDGNGKFLYIAQRLPDLSNPSLHGFAVTGSGILTQLVSSPFPVPSSMADVIAVRVVSVRQ